MNISSIVDRLQTLFGWGYILAGILPALLFIGVSVLVANAAWSVTDGAITWLSNVISDQTLISLVILVLALAIIGFIIWAMNPLLRQILEGSHLPGFLVRSMTSRHRAELEKLERSILSLQLEVIKFRRASKHSPTWLEVLRSARVAGESAAHSVNPGGTLRSTWVRLSLDRALRQSIKYTDMQALGWLLMQDLQVCSAARNRSLNWMQDDYHRLYDYASGMHENKYIKAIAERRSKYPDESDLAPTIFGNAAALHRDYGIARYGLDIEFFWSRLQTIVIKDTNLAPIIDRLRLQLDFSVSMVWTFALLAVVWLTAFAVVTVEWWLYTLLVGGCILAALAFYETGVRHYRTFSDAVQAAVDLHRFELLKTLHIALPLSPVLERSLWPRIEANTADYSHDDVV
jgi:hypothetical protein